MHGKIAGAAGAAHDYLPRVPGDWGLVSAGCLSISVRGTAEVDLALSFHLRINSVFASLLQAPTQDLYAFKAWWIT
jgi:hypothetical protein